MDIEIDYSGTKLLLVTANVGSLFEDPKRLLTIWLEEFIGNITKINPRFLALHLQEVGGKTYENSMENVQEFIRCLCEAMAKAEYLFVRIYMDEDFKSAEHFTALGNIYFGHKDLSNLRIWNFQTHSWDDKLEEGKHIFCGNIEAIPTKEKAKFPQHFFPECKWSRKGFMRTRWEINGTAIDLVNIHLFHDASNLAACEDFPSVYCKTRRRALVHTIERFHLDDENGSVPFFLFGDFNFRCDTAGVVKELTANLTAHRLQSVKNDCTKINYRNSEGNNILTVGKKEFSHADHQLKFKEYWLKSFDKELEPLKDFLVEFPITFIPSYPFEEDPEMPTDYMSTRCPSWCDRILMSPQVKEIIENDDWKYDLIGENVCMGDHKPIYLTVHLKPNKGTYISCDCSCTHMLANNNILTSPVKFKTCPYISKLYNEVIKEGKTISQERKLRDCAIEYSVGLLYDYRKTYSGPDETTIHPATIGEGTETIQNGRTNNPSISIDLIDSDNICVCMCMQIYNSDSVEMQSTNKICPICRNIKAKQATENHFRLFSNTMEFSQNIIVNQIDTQHLNTYIEKSQMEPYTPESNESHSPYPEAKSTITNNSYKHDDCAQFKNLDDDQIKKYCVQNENYDLCSLKCICTSTEKESRSSVTPVQLISRLEDLQRMHTSESNDASDQKGDVNNVESSIKAASLVETLHSLKSVMDHTLVDDSLWREQSIVDDTGTQPCPTNTRYVVLKAISSKTNMSDDNNFPDTPDAEKSILLKETTV